MHTARPSRPVGSLTWQLDDLGRLLLRLLAGGWLLPHGLGKLTGWFGGPGLSGFARELAQFGLPSAPPWPGLIASLQVAIALLLVLGAWTRGSALVGATFLGVTVALNAHAGWYWMGGGVEYPLLWALLMTVVAMLGPGRWSIDHRQRLATESPP